MMLLQQDNDHADTSSHAYVHTLAGADGHTRLSLGTHLDPGIRRKHRPNEDTVLITHGVMPFASPEPFVLLAVADGMGGHRGMARKQASSLPDPWSRICLAPSLHCRGRPRIGFLSSQRVSSMPIGSCMSVTSNSKPSWARR